ncbi:uncharacterized protein LOC126785149 [Argentina anserina]|uniref:uncharacterized protein LOC126785149 n=1 Tax=Argentina anserina TaxID=57926 RepID=UPI002176842E|nr:uncharacterized protein LOC126785149 [Potentilla anserina]
MGICSSSSSVVTTKLVLQDGQLQEFSNPVRASYVLQKINSPGFVCDADDMDYGGFITAVNGDEELHLGQLYFVLPLNWLNKPLRAEEMAALAVRASLALRNMRRSSRRCCKGGDDQVVFSIMKKDVKPKMVTSRGSFGVHPETVRKRRSYTSISKLSVILEGEDRKEDGTGEIWVVQ